MKKIAILSPFFYPELISSGRYNTDLAKQLCNLGLDVQVFCSHPLYPDWKPVRGDKLFEKINIVRGGLWMKYPKNNNLRRLFLEIWYFIFVFKNFKFINSCDAVILVFPPSLFGILLKLLNSDIKIFGIVHDLQTIHLENSEKGYIKILAKIIKFVENIVFQTSHKLIFLSSEMRDQACLDYKINIKDTIISYPSVNIKNFKNKNKLSNIFADNFRYIVYSGALGKKQNPSGILEIAQLLVTKIENTKFIICSRGPEFNEIKNKNILANIMFHDLVENDDLGELLVRSDVQFIPQASGTSKGSLPSKLPNILASGTKLLTITDKNSELEQILKHQEGCLISNSWNPEENVKYFKTLLDLSSKKFDRSQNLSQYERSFLAKFIREFI